MKTVGNILWLLIAGIPLAIAYAVFGLLGIVLIVTIPFGIQSFKLAGYALWPFGRVVVHKRTENEGLSIFGNVIWFLIAGFWLAALHVIVGVVLMITIIGIPFGLASFKMAGLAVAPFGREVVDEDDVRARTSENVVRVTPVGRARETVAAR